MLYPSRGLRRGLAAKLNSGKISGVFVVQYGGGKFAERKPREAYVVAVIECAQAYGFAIADEFDTISAVATRSTADLISLYVMRPGGYGHMSPEGNDLVAGLIADAIGR